MIEKDYVTRHEFNQVEKRVGKAEDRLTRNETKIEHIEKTLSDIKGNTNKILWIIVSAVVFAVLRLIFVEGLI